MFSTLERETNCSRLFFRQCDDSSNFNRRGSMRSQSVDGWRDFDLLLLFGLLRRIDSNVHRRCANRSRVLLPSKTYSKHRSSMDAWDSVRTRPSRTLTPILYHPRRDATIKVDVYLLRSVQCIEGQLVLYLTCPYLYMGCSLKCIVCSFDWPLSCSLVFSRMCLIGKGRAKTGGIKGEREGK